MEFVWCVNNQDSLSDIKDNKTNKDYILLANINEVKNAIRFCINNDDGNKSVWFEDLRIDEENNIISFSRIIRIGKIFKKKFTYYFEVVLSKINEWKTLIKLECMERSAGGDLTSSEIKCFIDSISCWLRISGVYLHNCLLALQNNDINFKELTISIKELYSLVIDLLDAACKPLLNKKDTPLSKQYINMLFDTVKFLVCFSYGYGNDLDRENFEKEIEKQIDIYGDGLKCAYSIFDIVDLYNFWLKHENKEEFSKSQMNYLSRIVFIKLPKWYLNKKRRNFVIRQVCMLLFYSRVLSPAEEELTINLDKKICMIIDSIAGLKLIDKQ